MTKIPVGILGATGMVGQNFVRLLEHHPWFEVAFVGASDRSAGKPYHAATAWRLDADPPAATASLTVSECKPSDAPRLVFSAMDASVATEIERDFAAAGHIVVSNSRNHRMDPDVPLLIPEVNPSHLDLIPLQRRNRNWSGAIVTNPNCSTIAMTLALAPLLPFGIDAIVASTMQAVSGAGYPGVPSWDILGNVIPYIGGEEDKMQTETLKILGTPDTPLPARVSASCHRVPVLDGHLVATSVSLRSQPSLDQIVAAIQSFQGEPQILNLPSAPHPPVLYLGEETRPQPRRDALRGNGMTVSVGRLRTCPILGYKFIALAHNTIRGAAGAAILNAELLHSKGLLHE
jgi:aspartate-semialdehyde dehydrogenase